MQAQTTRELTIDDLRLDRLSVRNQIAVLTARPEATYVGGFKQWLALGRCVARGEHGTKIFVPSVKGKDREDAGETYFVMGTVFDISQTVELDAKS